MKITKILVALSFLFATVTANAGSLTVTGNMETTYHSQSKNTTGNPLGMDRELKFAGSTELDNGITVSVFQDTGDSLTYANSQIMFSGISTPAGALGIYVGSDSDPLDAVDDITPSAYEEANGSGSGTYVDIGSNAGQMGLGLKFDLPFLGAVDYKHYPKIDGAKNTDNSSSGTVAGAAGSGVGSAYSVSIKTDLGATIGQLDGLTWTNAFGEAENSRLAATDDSWEATSALNYSIGSLSLGLQRKATSLGQTAIDTVGTDTAAIVHTDTVIGIAYAVNDAFSVSYNRYTSNRSSPSAVNNEQETDAFNIGYTMGGMTIGFQDASTDNANYVLNAEDDTRTLGVSVAF
jgi:hypothetical protein